MPTLQVKTYTCILPVEFMKNTLKKHVFKYFTPEIEVIYYQNYRFQDYFLYTLGKSHTQTSQWFALFLEILKVNTLYTLYALLNMRIIC